MNKNKRSVGRPKGTKYAAYRVFLTLLYGRHDFIDRCGDGVTRVPVAACANHFKLQAGILKAHLRSAENWGFINRLHWNNTWFDFIPEVPPGMCVNVTTENIYPELEPQVSPDEEFEV